MHPVLKFEDCTFRAADLGEESSVPDLLGEAILQNQLKFNLDEEDEIYEGYGRKNTAYPYRQRNGYTRALKKRKIKTAVLENDYLRAVFLPEYGGRLWKLWDKKAKRDLLYTNDVLRFSNLAVRNAWFSGGVEWNIGVIGHTPLTTEPLYAAQTETETGDPVLRMYEYERIREVIYQMDFWLDEESPFLNCRMRIVNESAEVVPMYWWSNIAVPEYRDGQVTVPAEHAFTNHDGIVYKVEVPVVDHTDITAYGEIKTSVDYFFDIPETEPKYIANVDQKGYGLFHISTNRLRSRKLFSWGNQEGSDRWQEFLTEKAGRYLEVQAGLAKSQYGCIPMAPHTAWEWMEQYGAVQLPAEVKEKDLQERSWFLTGKIEEGKLAVMLEKRLLETKAMATAPAKIVMAGSGYGAMEKHGKAVAHLEFQQKEESLKRWKHFFKTGVLHCPDPMEKPDEFLIYDGNLEFMKQAVCKKNRENWYAYYQLGIGYYVSGKYKKAKKALEKSLELAQNPWALHGLSCIFLMKGKKKKAAEVILKGMEINREDLSYIKEGFRILCLSGKYGKLCGRYKKLDKNMQENSRVRFYYIKALHMQGKDKKAYKLLEKDGGFVLDDIREGEDSLMQLWSGIYQNLYGKEEKIPHRYNFKAV